MFPDWLTGFPYSVMHSLNLDWLLKKVASIDPSGFVRSINDTLRPDPETGNLNLTAGDVGALGVYGTANNSLLLDGKPSAYYLTPVNLLDNSDFRNPINQRGYTNDTTVEKTYFIDRWSTTDASSFSLGTHGMEIKSGFCHQSVSISKIKSGHAYTLACKMNGNILCYNGVAEEQIGAWEDGLVSIYYAEQAITVYLTKAGATYEWVALYEGAYTAETLPPYVPKPYAVELAVCQRYYLPLIQTPVGFGYVFNNVAVINVPLPQPMRAIPSIADGLTFYIIQTNGNTLSSTSYSISGMSGNALQLNVVLSDAVENSPVIAFTNNFALNLDL